MIMNPTRLLTFLVLTALCVATITVFAQEKKPQTWEEQKAAKLKPLTAEQKELIEKALPAKSTEKPKKDRKILVFYRCEGFVHTSIPAGNHALELIGAKTGAFTAEVRDDYAAFDADNLSQYDAIIFNNTTHLKMKPEHRAALLDFIKRGKGIVGIHAASDNFGDWPEGVAMMGGQFNGHPWTAGGEWAFKLDDPNHTLNRSFEGKGFWHTDEIYQYNPETYVGDDETRILVSLDMSKAKVTAVLENPKFEKFNEVYGGGKREVPVSWLRKIGEGRLFYTNFGHREDTFWKPSMLRHYLDGIQYALGDLEADPRPTAKMEGLSPALAPAGDR